MQTIWRRRQSNVFRLSWMKSVIRWRKWMRYNGRQKCWDTWQQNAIFHFPFPHPPKQYWYLFVRLTDLRKVQLNIKKCHFLKVFQMLLSTILVLIKIYLARPISSKVVYFLMRNCDNLGQGTIWSVLWSVTAWNLTGHCVTELNGWSFCAVRAWHRHYFLYFRGRENPSDLLFLRQNVRQPTVGNA